MSFAGIGLPCNLVDERHPARHSDFFEKRSFRAGTNAFFLPYRMHFSVDNMRS